MKKVLIIIFLIFTILISFFNTSYAAVTVTKENLSQAFKSFVSSEANEDNYAFSVEDNVINITKDNETCALNYDLTGKPTFSCEVDVKKGMSYDDFKKETDNLFFPMYGYIAVANIQGVKFEDVTTYFLFSYLESALGSKSPKNPYIIYDGSNAADGITIERDENSKIILVSEFGDRIMEYTNALYPKTLTISDSDSEGINSYTMTIEKKDVTETSCKLVSKLIVNTEADFSKLNGTMDKIEDSFYGDITKENADYVLTLKVGQKCKIDTSDSFGCAYSEKIIKIDTDLKEITALKVGDSIGHFYTSNDYFFSGSKTSTFYNTVEENPNNEPLETLTLKIDSTSDSNNSKPSANTNTSLQESVNKVTNSTSKLPQTGNFFNVKDALLFLILACAAGIVFLMIPNVKYKNIK